MCRLFGMATGGPRIRATFWLMDAPDSLEEQSRRMPDGVGLGWFSSGDEPVVDRAPMAAYMDTEFAKGARDVESSTFVSHIRYASTGAVDVHNCQPFSMHDRLFAHNGVVKGLDVLNSWLTDVDRALVEGQTDSELVFAYLTAEMRRRGDTTTGLVEGIRRIAAELPLYALNVILAERGRVYALRYPDTHRLWVLPPKETGLSSPDKVRHLSGRRERGSVHVGTSESPVHAYVVASEPMDDDPAWRLLDPGELLVMDGLQADSRFPFDAPAHRLSRDDLSPHEAASQHHAS
ncbi:class II glutamine amidotransferase [Thermomonospora umbrina]|uniref:Glutamine amidotransferase n=1 Tax=Thermomonospora umbrina TaxID=111806 RepID=A0A3D9SPT7_9ACTN|nr:class II glutamine amidotransferase [Thermomonospora umbrina]REE94945.1 glutamine amidotransferase [Thermomonospora umbrina]